MGLSAIIVEADVHAAAPTIASWTAAQQTLLLSAACTVADQYIGRNLATAAAVEYYDGSKSLYLNLKRWPVTLMTEVKFDRAGGFGQIANSFGTDTILTQGTDYILDSARGILQLVRSPSGGDWFSRGYTMPTVQGQYGRGLVAGYVPAQWGQVFGSVKVSYTAGLTQATQDLVVAVAQIMTYMARVNDSGGLVSTSVGYIDVSDSTEVKQVVEALRGGLPALGTSRQILDNYRTPYTGGWIL